MLSYTTYVYLWGLMCCLTLGSCASSVRSVEHNTPMEDGFPSRYPDRAQLMTMLQYRNLERSHARRPQPRKAVELSRYYYANFAVDSAIRVLETAAALPNATEAVHSELLGRLNEVERFEEAQVQLDLALQKTRHPERYRRQTTLLALQLGRSVDYASPNSGLTTAEVLHVRAAESALRGDIITTLISAEIASYLHVCEVGTRPWPSLLLNDTYQKLLAMSVARQSWPVNDYPAGSFEAVYAQCLEAAFSEVAVDRSIASPYYELAYAAVTQAQQCVLTDRTLSGKPVLVVQALAKLHQASAYRPYFYRALAEGALLKGSSVFDPSFQWYVTYFAESSTDASRSRAAFDRSLICELISGMRQP